MSRYRAEVIRNDSEAKGPGTFWLFRDDVVVGEWQCHTGDQELDPQVRGGLTPPIRWRMTEPIGLRRHPQGHQQVMARIYPVLTDEMADFPERGFALDEWPFMIHVAGRSTGCIAILRDDWEDASDKLNRAYEEDGEAFVIEVVA